MTRHPELGFYALAGAPESPRAILQEVRDAEAMGLGTAFVSERYNVKEAVAQCGAAGAVSDEIRIATAVTNHNTRHPLITASFATTMHYMTDGRFALGLGRGIAMLQDLYGIPRISTAELEDIVGIYRRLWRGEMIFGHSGAAGDFQFLHLDAAFDAEIPLLLSAFGPKTLSLGGRAFDEVVLHTFFTPDATQNAVRTVKRAAEEAGRDPDSVAVWSCFATVGDHLPEDLRLRKTVGRLATYLQGYGDLLVRTNDWSPEVLEEFRSDPVVGSMAGGIDHKATTEQLEHIAELIPDEWLAPAATGTASQCVDAIDEQFSLGCDRVILHGATPTELAPIVDEYSARRGR